MRTRYRVLMGLAAPIVAMGLIVGLTDQRRIGQQGHPG